MKVIAATHNKNKLREFREILEPLGFEIISAADAGADIEPEETGATFEENAAIKAHAIHAETGGAALADDSGLCVDALGGEPGIYSARYGSPELDDRGRLELLLEKMRAVPTEKRTARFMCSIVFVDENGSEIRSTGSVEGIIAAEPSGENGFGYDPIFYSPQLGKTFAEASADEKNGLSHRAVALEGFRQALEKR